MAGENKIYIIRELFIKLNVLLLVFGFLFQPVAPVFAKPETSAKASVSIKINDKADKTKPQLDKAPDINIEQQVISIEAQPKDKTKIFDKEDGQNIKDGAEAKGDKAVKVDVKGNGQDQEDSPVTELAESASIPLEIQQPSDNYPTKQNLPEIDKNTGALSYNFSVSVPPGRNNFQPDIVLSYNSNSNSQNSIFGYGWSLSIPYIQRLNKKGIDKLYDATADSYFYSSFDGELAAGAGSSFIARTENGSFNKYTFSDNQWLITAKDGRQYKFGYDESSQQNDPANPGNVYKWMLEEVRDVNDNYISYSYFKDIGQIYPLAIKYTGNGGVDGIFEINFSREARPDNIAAYNTGFSVATNYRINQITASVNGNWANKYVLSYSQSQNINKSLLKSITASGKNSEENITNFSPTTFDYQYKDANWSADFSWDFPNPDSDFQAGASRNNLYPYFVDLNGDGLSDLVTLLAKYKTPESLYPYKTNKEFMNTGNGWTEAGSLWELPDNSSWNISEDDFGLGEIYFPDLNGDGLADLVERVGNGGGPPAVNYVYINNGNGWTEAPPVWKIPEEPELAYRRGTQHYFIDLNGDGLSDFVQLIRINNYNFTSYVKFKDIVYINNGNGWTEADSFWNLEPINDWLTRTHSDGSLIELKFPDLNGDGLADAIVSHLGPSASGPDIPNSWTNEYSEIYFNTGRGWTQANSEWNFPKPQSSYWINKTQLTDLDNDGLPDLNEIVQIHNTYKRFVYINNGHGWNSSYIDYGYFSEQTWFLVTWNSVYSKLLLPQFPDLNGDGLEDYVEIISAESPAPQFSNKDNEYINTGEKLDLLIQINYPLGGSASISYETNARYKTGREDPTNRMPFPMYAVSKIINNDGLGNSASLSYQFDSPHYYYNNPFDKQFSGYDLIQQKDKDGFATKTYYYTADESNSAEGEYQDNYFKLGKVYRTEMYDVSNNLFQATINKWDSYDLGNGAGFVKLIQTVKQDFDATPSHKDKAESYEYENNTGNLSRKIEWGEVLASDDGSFTDTGNDKNTTNLSYASSLSSSVAGSPSAIVLYNQNSNKISEARYYYDNLPLGSISFGNQTKEEKWVSGGAYVNTQKTYNNFGLITQSKDANGNPTDYTYDSYALYPTSATNALNQTTQYVYNYGIGKIAQATDANNNTFKNTYDGFGRILKTEQPDETNQATLVVKTSYSYSDAPQNVNVQAVNYLDNLNFVASYNYYDGLGRILQTKKSAENNNFSTRDFIYDNRGNLQKESLPYFSNISSRTSPTSTPQLYTAYVYDALNRKTSSADAVGATSFAYQNWQTIITDANGKQKDFLYDAYNNLIQVKEHNGADTYITSYVYDTLGNLTNITDALGNVRNFTYDSLGRRLTAQDLHNPSDSIFGIWNYTYDSAGNLTRLVNPKSQIVNYVYDVLNRKIKEDYTAGKGIEASFTYDICQNGIGRLCKTVLYGFEERYEYSATGNIIKDTKKIGTVVLSETFITEYASDRQGSQTLITNPDLSQIKYQYNQAGLVESVLRKESSDVDFKNIVNNFDYNPVEQITLLYYASGTQTTNTYDQNQLYRLTRKLSSANGVNLQDISYQYDVVGNIKQIIDNSATDARKTVAYTYDDLYRLTSAVATNTANTQDYTESFVYDAVGNILSKETNGEKRDYRYKGNLNNTGSDFANPDAITETTTENKGFRKSISLKINRPGLKTDPITINIIEPGPLAISSFTPSSSAILPGQSVTLSWEILGKSPETLSIDNGVGNVRGKTSITVKPSATTTYTITATAGAETAARSVVVTVSPDIQQETVLTSYKYDKNGNITVDGAKAYSYDYNNRLVSAIIPNKPTNTRISYAYDYNGQRIKSATITNDSVDTTYYPTQFYNTSAADGAVKHIFANNLDIATIEGSGADTQIYFNLADQLQSSNVITDATGAIVETMDYYPFGKIRLDNKTTDFAEQRKYIGQEYDEDTGLNYLNARYYNSAIARFVSQDPIALATPEKLLQDPQQLNYYSYARNNPIIGSDPTGLLVFFMPGTQLGGGRDNYTISSQLEQNIHTVFPGQEIIPVNWEGSDTTQARQQGAQNLAKAIEDKINSSNVCEPINIVDHSHGRNAVAEYTRFSDAHQINTVIDIAGPILADNPYNESKVNNHINVYSNLDPVQIFAGDQLSASGATGAAVGSVFGLPGAGVGFAAGQLLKWGEFGIAGRQDSGAKNINATQQASWSPWLTHGSLLNNSSVWTKISKEIKK